VNGISAKIKWNCGPHLHVRNRITTGQSNNSFKNISIEIGVATIVYYGKL